MPKRIGTAGSELFIVDNSDEDWKVVRYLRDWRQTSSAIRERIDKPHLA